jgi:poly(hydroxyalkanoate) granule-associated protein
VDQAKAKMDDAKAKVSDTVENWSAKVDEAVTSALHRLGVPTREEIRTLTHRVEELNSKVEFLRPRVTPAETVIVTPVTAEPTDPSKIIV